MHTLTDISEANVQPEFGGHASDCSSAEISPIH